VPRRPSFQGAHDSGEEPRAATAARIAEAAPTRDLARRLREAAAGELAELVEAHAGTLDEAAAEQALRNPYAGAEVIAALADQRGLARAYAFRRAVVFHPRSPQPVALQWAGGLYWRDLVALGLETRVRPVVRRAADRHLIARLPGFALGEKIAIARRAGGGVIGHLRHDPSVRVLAALLENPRLTEGLLAPLVHRENAAPEVLRLIAENPRWGLRYPLRTALARNPRTPVATALRLLPSLKKVDLRAVVASPRVAPAVRRRARLLSGGR
jgi:hypothetical protein